MTPTSPRLGVEIEFTASVSQSAISRALADHGIAAAVESYNHATRDYWKITTDSSCGLELVSPPLEWHQRLQIRSVMNALNEAGAQVNKDCGYHVHHEWPWIGHLSSTDQDERLVRIRQLYRSLRPLLVPLLSASRWEHNTFCKWNSAVGVPPWCSDHESRSCGFCADCDEHGCGCFPEDWEDDDTNIGHNTFAGEDLHNDRYQAVNFCSLTRQPTVEYRQHQGTLNAAKAIAWAELTRNITHAASRQELPITERFPFIFDKLSTSTWSYLRSRCESQGCDLDRCIAESAVLAEALR